jgi:hypothetical protein
MAKKTNPMMGAIIGAIIGFVVFFFLGLLIFS